MKSLTILGSTGSIGRNTLNIAARFPEEYTIKALTAKSNLDLLAEQIRKFQPDVAVVYDGSLANELKAGLPRNLDVEILHGSDGYCQAARLPGTDMVVGAMVGAAGLEPTLAAIEAGKDIALANKETLVMAGSIVMQKIAETGVQLLPVDSEHSAIFQCLQGQRRQDLDKIILTASGGPFLDTPAEDLAGITPDRALKHPNWDMGAKITIDSATLMNKGLEVIEARWLFDLAPGQIEVLVHPQSIIHSMAAYKDGSILAQMGIPDMQQAIAYALSYPRRLGLQQALPDFAALGQLTFRQPDMTRFPCLRLAFDACRTGGTLPAVMNAANEVAVQAFLNRQLAFTEIPKVVEAAMKTHQIDRDPDVTAILNADAWARKSAKDLVQAA
ncbi:MAG: 1-deoxy-D-xylulose-5-phosphate reductoisomerase [Desulfobacteraceae bacterium]|jgi:1-deoxy-D-xylulose-5-phosphate reductoisomerase